MKWRRQKNVVDQSIAEEKPSIKAVGTKLIDAARSKKKGEVFKDVHYFEVYDQHFLHLKDRKINLLEIGIAKGGSLWMWKNYFKNSTITGVDIKKGSKKWKGDNIEVIIGDQNDSAFLENLGQTKGSFDIIIDDGSHISGHQIKSFEILFKYVKDAGVYVIEDLGTSYWPKFGGGLNKPDSCIERLKRLIDDIHLCHCRKDTETYSDPIPKTYFEENISSIHFYNSMCFIYKKGIGFNPESSKAIRI